MNIDAIKDEIRGIIWSHSDASDEPDESWLPSDNFEKVIDAIYEQFKAEQKQSAGVAASSDTLSSVEQLIETSQKQTV